MANKPTDGDEYYRSRSGVDDDGSEETPEQKSEAEKRAQLYLDRQWANKQAWSREFRENPNRRN